MRKQANYCLLFSFFLLLPHIVICQPKVYNDDSIKTWTKELSFPGNTEPDPVLKIKNSGLDRRGIIKDLESFEEDGNPWFRARLYCLKALASFKKVDPASKDSVSNYFKKALNIAYESGEDQLIYAVSLRIGEAMRAFNDLPVASMYFINAAEIDEKNFVRNYVNPFMLGEMLYHTKEYEKCIYYTRRSIESNQPLKDSFSHWVMMSCWNTIGLAHQKMGNYDSALADYEVACRYATEINNKHWVGIISGNKGQVYFLMNNYPEARKLLEFDYKTSWALDTVYTDNAGNSLQWVAKIDLLLGNKILALAEIREAHRLLKKMPTAGYRRNLYSTAAEIYRANGFADSFAYFNKVYYQLNDSIESSIANSRVATSRLKLENEQFLYKMKELQRVRDAEKQKRNFIILAIVLLAVIVLFYLNRQRLKAKHKEQLISKEKEKAEAEISATREQLDLFTKSLIEKTSLLESLQHQLEEKNQTKEQQDIIAKISEQTILTDADWEKFKSLYEKLYPGFFFQLKQKSPDITLAEQRMAALTRLRLENKEIAGMLGISAYSVNKTRQRLRQRLALQTDQELQDFVDNL